ncbi:MAG: PQQ-binding-like beta-propeller repeat protein, partial [Planctomycetaceae bacterium]|nr:PQQ-binding-like beta-propeller repeat protein [Planctomycetaceae bacterium]
MTRFGGFLVLSMSLVLCVSLAATEAAEWSNWRGPHGNGVADGAGYPTEWSTDKNLKWTVALRGSGASTPVVVGDRIFLTAADDNANLVICVGMDGKEQWVRELGSATAGKHRDGTGANPSPVTDGERVFVYFKSGDFGCFSVDGSLQWQTNIFHRFAEVNSETLWWDLGTSPVLTSNAVVVTMMHSGPSYLAAFNPADGKVLWKHDRVTDAPREAAQSYTTPVVTRDPDGREVIIVTGADYVTCHDASDGKELWRVGSLNPERNEYFRSISS